MKKESSKKSNELVKIPRFDFKNSLPNKYSGKYSNSATITIHKSEKKINLEPDVAEYFPDSESVNTALRALIFALSKIVKGKYSH